MDLRSPNENFLPLTMPSTANTYRFRQLLDPNDILFQRREADLSVYSRMNPKEVQEIQNILQACKARQTYSNTCYPNFGEKVRVSR